MVQSRSTYYFGWKNVPRSHHYVLVQQRKFQEERPNRNDQLIVRPGLFGRGRVALAKVGKFDKDEEVEA